MNDRGFSVRTTIHLAEGLAGPPDEQAVHDLFVAYLGSARRSSMYMAVPHEAPSWVVELIGEPADPRAPDARLAALRGFNVYLDGAAVTVTTRDADPFTVAVARGFAELAAEIWGGTYRELVTTSPERIG